MENQKGKLLVEKYRRVTRIGYMTIGFVSALLVFDGLSDMYKDRQEFKNLPAVVQLDSIYSAQKDSMANAHKFQRDSMYISHNAQWMNFEMNYLSKRDSIKESYNNNLKKR